MGLSATNKETQGFLKKKKKKQRDRAFTKKKRKGLWDKAAFG